MDSCYSQKRFCPYSTFKVCQLHFTEDQIRRTAEAYDERTGRKIVAPLKRLYLKDGAIPCVFKNIPKYLSNPIHSRESRDQRLERLENEQLELALSESIGTGVGVTNNRTGIGTWCTKLHKLNFNAILQKVLEFKHKVGGHHRLWTLATAVRNRESPVRCRLRIKIEDICRRGKGYWAGELAGRTRCVGHSVALRYNSAISKSKSSDRERYPIARVGRVPALSDTNAPSRKLDVITIDLRRGGSVVKSAASSRKVAGPNPDHGRID
ncbi:hypothetical protein EVAR_16897_1 [Eumeta japonica]|uniref:THAP-type domain-containing protein n=1 Tax=Eumeta variegata TaxID=151549 RepID=A0A4C1TVA0_EUMVA|nr:hypothetical protein EVAR_16897_1 [Eumeta japonica]